MQACPGPGHLLSGQRTCHKPTGEETTDLPGLWHFHAFLISQSVKNLPATQETWVRFLGQEDTLEKETATHSSSLTWKTPWTEESEGATVHGIARLGHDLATKPPWRFSTNYENTCKTHSWLVLWGSEGALHSGNENCSLKKKSVSP